MKSVDSKNKKNLLSKLPKRIRAAREKAHLSQHDLAKSIGISDKSISSYEKGRSTPPFDKLKKISEFTNLPIHFFIGENSDELTIVSKLKSIEQELEEIKKLLKTKK